MLALMETQTQVHVSFAEVKERLLAIKTPSADTVEQILDRIQALLTLLKTFEEVYPEQYRTQMIGVTLTPKELPDEEENFIDHFLHLVEKQFPLDFEGTIEKFYNEGCGNLFLYIQPCGMPVSDDEIEEAVSENCGTNYSSLEICMLFLCSPMTGQSHWNWAKKYFKWKFPEPKSLTRNVESVDWDLLYAKFDEEGLSPLKVAFDVVGRSTENIFIDYNPYDQSTLDPCYDLSFTKETVEMLAREWANAIPILEQHHKAIEMMDEDPSVGRKLIKLWDQCCKFKKGE